MESTVRNLDKDEKTEIPKKTMSPRVRVIEGSSDGEDERDNDVLEFVLLLEISESSDAMKGLLLNILNSNKFEELKPFLKDRSTERQRRPKKQGSRRSSLTKSSDLSEHNNGSSHRKSTKTNTSGALTKLNSVTNSLGSSLSSLRRARQSEGCLRKSQHDAMQSPNQKSRLLSSSSLLQLRSNRRADVSRRRSIVSPSANQDDIQVEKKNPSRNSAPGGISMSKRGVSTGSFLRPAPLASPPGKNASWGTAVSPTSLDKMRQKVLLRKLSEKKMGLSPKKRNESDHRKNGEKKSTKLGLSPKKKNGSDHSKNDERKSKAEMNDSRLNNGFAQFCPTGQVAYRENQVCLNDLVGDLNSYKDSIRSFNKLNDADDETVPEKKGLRKYLKQQLTKKGMDKDKQCIASESMNEKYASLSEDNKFHAGDVSIAS